MAEVQDLAGGIELPAPSFVPTLIDGPAGHLRVAIARPPDAARGTVLVLQGRGEIIEKYAPVVARITAWGYNFVTLDWRGQGGSVRLLADPRKGHVGDFGHYVDDLEAAWRWAQGQGLPAPHLLLAHSMGGQVAMLALGEHRLRVEAAVFVAPMLDIDFHALPDWLARAIARMAQIAGLGTRYAPGQVGQEARRMPFEGNPLTTDRARFAAWQQLMTAHDRYAIGGVTYGWIAAAVRSIARTTRPRFLSGIATPCLLIRAGQETIVANGAIAAAARLLPNATLVDLPGARHDLFQAADATRDVLFSQLHAFFTRFSPPPG